MGLRSSLKEHKESYYNSYRNYKAKDEDRYQLFGDGIVIQLFHNFNS